MQTRLLILIALLVSPTAQADWTKVMEAEYVMGDNDSKISARQSALDQLKLKASSEVGTYIQATTSLKDNGELTEDIQTVAASLVKINHISDKIELNKSGQSVLSLTGTVSVNEKEFMKQIESLRLEKDKMALLKKENEKLKQDLSLSNSKVANSKNNTENKNSNSRSLDEMKKSLSSEQTLLSMSSEKDVEDRYPSLFSPHYNNLYSLVHSNEGRWNTSSAVCNDTKDHDCDIQWLIETGQLEKFMDKYGDNDHYHLYDPMFSLIEKTSARYISPENLKKMALRRIEEDKKVGLNNSNPTEFKYYKLVEDQPTSKIYKRPDGIIEIIDIKTTETKPKEEDSRSPPKFIKFLGWLLSPLSFLLATEEQAKENRRMMELNKFR